MGDLLGGANEVGRKWSAGGPEVAHFGSLLGRPYCSPPAAHFGPLRSQNRGGVLVLGPFLVPATRRETQLAVVKSQSNTNLCQLLPDLCYARAHQEQYQTLCQPQQIHAYTGTLKLAFSGHCGFTFGTVRHAYAGETRELQPAEL